MVKKIMSMLLAVVLLFSIAPLHLYDTAWAAAGQRSASTSRSYPTLAASDTWYKGSTAKSSITEITLMNSGKPSGTVAESWDASAAQDGSITAYIVGTKLTLVGNGRGKIAANADSSYAFSGKGNAVQLGDRFFNHVTAINGLNLLDTSKVINMAGMFRVCEDLTSLNLSNFNTAKVTDMSYMFYECVALSSLDLSSFNTANVTDMGGMFQFCSDLTKLDVSQFNTDNVTDMDGMFWGCKKLTSLNLSNFNTANVTNMGAMFRECTGLTSLDVSKFNTANVTVMNEMFGGCSALTKLDVSKFNTAKVTWMPYIFNGCRALTSLNLSDWDTSKVTSMSHMFGYCDALTSLNLSNFNTANVTDMSYMFYSCDALTNLDLSNFNTANVTSMCHMSTDCNKLKTVTLGKNFKFVKNSYDLHLLPTPSSGKWYDTTTGTGYTPAQLASVTRTETRTYSALSDTPADVTLGSAKISGSNIVVTWSAARGASKYNVYRKGPGDTSWKLVSTVTGTSYTDSNVTAGSTYRYTVRGVASDGKTLSISYNRTGVSATMPPANVTLTAAKVSGSDIVVTWKAATGAKTYRVYRKTADSSWTAIAQSVTGTSYTDKTASKGVKYVYTVRALNNSSISASYDRAGVSAVIPPANVTMVSAKADSAGILVTWKAASGAETYNVYRKTAGSKWKLAAKAVSGTEWKDITAAKGTKYTYTVRGIADDGKTLSASYNKAGKSATVTKSSTTPANVVLGKATLAKDGITVTWSYAADAKTYRVYCKQAGEKSWHCVAKSVEGKSWTDTKVTKGVKYTYTVRGIAANGTTLSPSYNKAGVSAIISK